MPRPKAILPLATKLAQAFATVEKMKLRGHNGARDYNYLRAPDLFEALRHELLANHVLILPNEGQPEYVPVAQSNGGEQITECRLPVAYTFKDAQDQIGPYTVNGIGRDIEEKSLYKAQTGSRKALLKAVGLIAWEEDDPEFDGRSVAETDGAQEMREREAAKRPRAQKTVTPPQIHAFNDACERTGKSQDEVSGYLLTTHLVSKLCDLGRGKPFTEALKWAGRMPGGIALAPKPQAVPHQASLALPTPAPPVTELKIGNKTVVVREAEKGSYAL
jgi:hypothetical protein